MSNTNSISLTKTFASAIWVGKVDRNNYWTGMVDSELIDDKLVADPTKRKRLRTLIGEYETLVFSSRGSLPGINNVNIKNAQRIEFLRDQIYRIVVEDTDIELYLIYLLNKFDRIKKENPEEFKKINRACKDELDDCRKVLLSFNRIYAYAVYAEELNEYKISTQTIKEQEKMLRPENSRKLVELVHSIPEKQLPEEEEIVVLEDISSKILVPDLLATLTVKELEYDIYMVILRNYLLKIGISHQEIQEFSNDRIKELASEIHKYSDSLEYKETMSNAILMHLEYMDMEALVLTYMHRFIDDFKAGVMADFYLTELVDESKALECLLNRIIATGLVTNRGSVNLIGVDGEEITVTLKSIRDELKKFKDGVYLSPETERKIKSLLLSGRSNLLSCGDDVVKEIDFSRFEMEVISLLDFKNLKRFYEVGRLDKNAIEHIVRLCGFKVFESMESEDEREQELYKKLEDVDKLELLKFLYKSKIIDSKDLVRYYVGNEMSLEELQSLISNFEELGSEVKETLSLTEVLECYKDYVSKYLEYMALEDKENSSLPTSLDLARKKKDRVLELFNSLNKNLSIQEKEKLGEDILGTYYLEMQVEEKELLQESIIAMYEDGLISLENILDFDFEYILPMLDKLSLADSTKIREKLGYQKLIELVDTVFLSDEISDERKFIIVMNLFGEESEKDREAIKTYLSFLSFDDSSEKKFSSGNTRQKGSGKGSSDSKKYIYPDFVKWKFYKALDKDARVTRYSNGYVEFASPKFGKRIIEKYYEGSEPAYGTATYIISEKDYRANQASLITITKNGKILEGAELRSIVPRQDRIAHRTQSAKKTWMDEIVRYFGIDFERALDTRYSEEELKDLIETVEKYKTQYEMII